MSSSNEYMRIYMLARYRRRKAEAIKRLGGKCVVCGSRQRLQFDHVERRSGEDSFVGDWCCVEVENMTDQPKAFYGAIGGQLVR
jgi:hypothetical protein